ncbi:hypothetical protein EDC01DRAFT_668198 [Geopyxis carbonaria]|nr:hypothetical protein EDC01DRAFT_668198 [Geopyxis carbonaria]
MRAEVKREVLEELRPLLELFSRVEPDVARGHLRSLYDGTQLVKRAQTPTGLFDKDAEFPSPPMDGSPKEEPSPPSTKESPPRGNFNQETGGRGNGRGRRGRRSNARGGRGNGRGNGRGRPDVNRANHEMSMVVHESSARANQQPPNTPQRHPRQRNRGGHPRGTPNQRQPVGRLQEEPKENPTVPEVTVPEATISEAVISPEDQAVALRKEQQREFELFWNAPKLRQTETQERPVLTLTIPEATIIPEATVPQATISEATVPEAVITPEDQAAKLREEQQKEFEEFWKHPRLILAASQEEPNLPPHTVHTRNEVCGCFQDSDKHPFCRFQGMVVEAVLMVVATWILMKTEMVNQALVSCSPAWFSVRLVFCLLCFLSAGFSVRWVFCLGFFSLGFFSAGFFVWVFLSGVFSCVCDDDEEVFV